MPTAFVLGCPSTMPTTLYSWLNVELKPHLIMTLFVILSSEMLKHHWLHAHRYR